MIDPTNEDAGRRVRYQPRPDAVAEFGEVRAWSDAFVFVVYDGDQHAKATRREDLEWAAVPSEPAVTNRTDREE